MDTTGWRRRLQRAGGLRGGPGRRRLRRLRRAGSVELARGVQGAAACPGGAALAGRRRGAGAALGSGARCPGGCGVSRGRGAGLRRAVSRGRRRVQGARRWAPARGVQGASVSPGGGPCGKKAQSACWRSPRSPRSGAALRRHARGVALAHRARTLDMRSGGHGNSGSGRSMARGVAHGCLSDKSVLFHVEHKPGFTTGGPQWPHLAVPAPGGCCCAHPFQAACGRSHG